MPNNFDAHWKAGEILFLLGHGGGGLGGGWRTRKGCNLVAEITWKSKSLPPASRNPADRLMPKGLDVDPHHRRRRPAAKRWVNTIFVQAQ